MLNDKFYFTDFNLKALWKVSDKHQVSFSGLFVDNTLDYANEDEFGEGSSDKLDLKNTGFSLASEHYLNRFQSEGSQNKISKTTNYILEHLEERLSVNQMAEFTHMVPQSFCRWFKKHSGHSFISFLNQTRIERVCHLLVSSNLKIQDIAFSSGFESISHFNRTFQKLKGCSPRAFRNKNSKLNFY